MQLVFHFFGRVLQPHIGGVGRGSEGGPQGTGEQGERAADLRGGGGGGAVRPAGVSDRSRAVPVTLKAELTRHARPAGCVPTPGQLAKLPCDPEGVPAVRPAGSQQVPWAAEPVSTPRCASRVGNCRVVWRALALAAVGSWPPGLTVCEGKLRFQT